VTYGYMPGPGQVDVDITIPAGQHVTGGAIGILVLTLAYPLLPGNVANASTYDYPVLFKVLEGTDIPQILGADPSLLDKVIEGGRELERQGARAVIGACGYFANYQKEAAAALTIPTFLSSLIQIPNMRQSLKPGQKVGVICADRASLTPSALSQCGVDDLESLVIVGAQDLPEFRNILDGTGHLNSHQLEQELVGLAKQMVSENPDIGAILLECSDMPPYAWAVQNATRLPVFDFITMINWIQGAVVRRPFTGFM
jgi:hypothetical protein